ncbi:MAG: hypothetical protein WC623_17520 [Pedobacter sp.]|uniref:hypothetical protein n=1 Tax=Pedobacter sp. TaxID=1411316 RepID=UPI00356AE757
MEKEESKTGMKFSRMRGFFIMILGVVFFSLGVVISKRSELGGFNLIMICGAVAMLIGFGLQVWETSRKK